MINRRFAQLQFQTLAGSGSSIGDTSLVLQNFVDIDGNLVTMAAFGTKGYATLEPGNMAQEEQISFTGITQNPNGSATLTGVKNVGFLYPYTETSGLQKGHPGGVKFVITNTSGFYSSFANTDDDETISETWTFTNPKYPRMDTATPPPTDNEQFATKKYVDDTAIAGAPDATETVKGIVQLATSTETQAGTSTGTTGARLVPPNSLLNAVSAGAGSAGVIPVAGASGTVDQSFLNSNRTIGAVYSVTAQNLQITTDPVGPNDAVRKSFLTNATFGDGSDGSFSHSSGTTSFNDASKNIYQYTDFSLTGTANINLGVNMQGIPLYIYVQGDLTITSSTVPAVNANGRGGPSVPGGAVDTVGSNGSISDFSLTGTRAGRGEVPVSGQAGGGGAGGNGLGQGQKGGPGVAGGGNVNDNHGLEPEWAEAFNDLYPVSRIVVAGYMGQGGAGGSGGSSAGSGGGTGSASGAGGGCVIFIVGGNINITSVFEAKGDNGVAGGNGPSGGNGGGGGGGGGGGFFGVFYGGTVTANTATFTVTHGTGGAGGVNAGDAGGQGGDGGDGASLVKKLIPA